MNDTLINVTVEDLVAYSNKSEEDDQDDRMRKIWSLF
jgi:hypothetical protein